MITGNYLGTWRICWRLATWLPWPCMARGSTLWEYHLIMALHNISGKTKAQFALIGVRGPRQRRDLKTLRGPMRCGKTRKFCPSQPVALSDKLSTRSVEIENE